MEHLRTGGMTLVGVLNLVLGALFGLIGALMIFGGGFMPFANGEASGPPGGFIQFVGAGTVGANLLLLISGFGVMKMASWGRTLSIAYASLSVIVYGAALIGAGFDLFFVGALVYSFVLIAMFFTPGWKAAFGPPRSMPAAVVQIPKVDDGDEDREAA